jgi:hypothetical protein
VRRAVRESRKREPSEEPPERAERESRQREPADRAVRERAVRERAVRESRQREPSEREPSERAVREREPFDSRQREPSEREPFDSRQRESRSTAVREPSEREPFDSCRVRRPGVAAGGRRAPGRRLSGGSNGSVTALQRLYDARQVRLEGARWAGGEAHRAVSQVPSTTRIGLTYLPTSEGALGGLAGGRVSESKQ